MRKIFGNFSNFSALAAIIFRQENSLSEDGAWNHESIGYRYNNPGNLVFAHQPGATCMCPHDPETEKDSQGYAHFDTLANGVAATERQLAAEAELGLTLWECLRMWFPSNCETCVRMACARLRVSSDTPLRDLAKLDHVNFPELPVY